MERKRDSVMYRTWHEPMHAGVHGYAKGYSILYMYRWVISGGVALLLSVVVVVVSSAVLLCWGLCCRAVG